jgi:competence protein ComEC
MKSLLLFCLVLFGVADPLMMEETVRRIDLMLEGEEMAIVFLPLASGEATLLKHASGKTVLINTGGLETERQLKKLLNQFHVTEIDEVIITNDEEEYVANLGWIIDTFSPEKLIVSEQQTTFSYNCEMWKEGEVHELFPSLFAEALCTEGGDLTFSLQYGDLRLLYMGHANEAVEKRLLALPLNDVNILKIAHFGLSDRPHTAFLKHVDPQATVFFKKRDHVPNQRLLERLYEAWIDIYQTERVGAVVVKCDLDHYEVMTL